MLFAAGRGTRVREVAKDLPKPLIRVCGIPLIDYALREVDAAGIPTRVVNLHYKPEQLTEHLASRNDIKVSLESSELLDTGGGLLNALPLLDGEIVFTMNTDSLWSGGNPFKQLEAAWDPERMDALLLLVPKSKATGHTGLGDFKVLDDGRLERCPEGEVGPIYTGAQIIRTERLAEIGEKAFSLVRVWEKFHCEGRLFGLLHTGGWVDAGTPFGLARAEDFARRSGEFGMPDR